MTVRKPLQFARARGNVVGSGEGMGPRIREDTRGAAQSKPFPIKWEGN